MFGLVFRLHAATLAGVLGCVCAGVGAPLAPRHPLVGCAPWVCVFGPGFRLHPATPGWAVGLCVCWFGRSTCSHSWLGCAVWVRVFGLGFRLRAATPCWGVGVCVCWCAYSSCTPPLLAGVCGLGVCAWTRVSAAPRHSWLGCWAMCVLVCALRLHPATPDWGAVWACVFGLGFRLRPATPGWGFGVCVCWCACCSCTPPLLAGVCGLGVCARAPVSAAPRHSWLGCWAVCVLLCALRLHPATPGRGPRRGFVCSGSGFGCAPPLLAGLWGCGCVCSGSGFGCAPPLLAGFCGLWVGCCLAPVRVPWFVACCARSPGFWHAAAVAAWHLFVCLRCGQRRASLACLVAPCGALRLVRSGRSRCSGWLSRRRGAFPQPGGLRPRLYWAAARGTRRPAENRAPCACRWPLPRQGRWARSASYPFGAPRWGCPWRVPPALVLGCVRCGGRRVWTWSLTHSVSQTVRCSTGDSAGAPELIFVDANTAPCGSEGATSGSRACVRVLALLGRVGRVSLRGAFWCASPFLLAALGFCFACPPPGWGCPRLGPFFFLFRSHLLRTPFVSCFLWFPAPGALGLGAVCCLSCWPCRCVLFVLLASRFSALRAPSLLLCCLPGCWLLPGGCRPPPPFVSRGFSFRRSVPCVFFPCPRPRCLSLSLLSGPWVLWALALCFAFFFPPASRLSVSSRFFFPAWPLAAPWCLVPPPPFLCVWLVLSLPLGAPPPFFFFPCVRPRCLWLSLVFGPGCPRPWRCVLFALWASRFSALRALSSFSVLRLAVGCSLVVANPPPPCCLVLRSFFFALCAPVVSAFLWFPCLGCLGPRRCALFTLLASRFTAPHAFSPLSCLPSGR